MAVAEYGRVLRDESGMEPGAIADVALSVLHMHFNRMCGPESGKERASLSLLRESLQGHLARAGRS
jgi:hypothetical protein